MTYNITSNVSGIIGLWNYANTVTSNWFSALFVFAVFIIAFLALKGKFYQTADSFLYASFLTFIISTLLWASGLLVSKMVIVFLIFMILSALWSFLD